MLRTILKRLMWVAIVVVAVVSVLVVQFLHYGGTFKSLEPHFAGTCETLPLSVSAEDIQLDRTGGFAYLSALDRRGQIDGQDVRGTVLRLDLNVSPLSAQPALTAEPANFRPHGMSLYQGPDGLQRLFVISHPPGEPHVVEIFDRNAEGLFAPVRTVRNPLLIRPNAIVAVGPEQFYVANDSGARGRFEKVTEMLFRRALSTISYYEKGRMIAVGPKIASGTGIAASADGRLIYVSESNLHRIAVFERGLTTGELRRREEIDLGSTGDNLNVAEDGAIWVAAHAKVSSLVRHFGDAAKLAPTQILRVDASPAGKTRVAEVYLNAGDELSAGSVAAVYGNRLLLGSITQHKVLVCQRQET